MLSRPQMRCRGMEFIICNLIPLLYWNLWFVICDSSTITTEGICNSPLTIEGICDLLLSPINGCRDQERLRFVICYLNAFNALLFKLPATATQRDVLMCLWWSPAIQTPQMISISKRTYKRVQNSVKNLQEFREKAECHPLHWRVYRWSAACSKQQHCSCEVQQWRRCRPCSSVQFCLFSGQHHPGQDQEAAPGLHHHHLQWGRTPDDALKVQKCPKC